MFFGFQRSKVSCFPYILACVIYLCCYKNILCACAFYPLVFLTITLSHKARIPGKTNRIRNMAEAHPTDKVRTICSMVGLPNSGPITAVISTIIVPEVRIVCILPLYTAVLYLFYLPKQEPYFILKAHQVKKQHRTLFQQQYFSSPFFDLCKISTLQPQTLQPDRSVALWECMWIIAHKKNCI